MSDLGTLVPGGGITAAFLAVLGWGARYFRDERKIWAETLEQETARRVRDIAEAERVEADLRRRLGEAETAAAGYRDAAGDARRDVSVLRAQLTAETTAKEWLQAQLAARGGPAPYPQGGPR